MTTVLRGIFFVKFWETQGPKIRAQSPAGFISDEMFNSFDYKVCLREHIVIVFLVIKSILNLITPAIRLIINQ